MILLAGNLRGVRQAGAVFAVPTYALIAAVAALVAAGLVHAAGLGSCAARILDCVADLRCHQLAGWLAGCCSRSSTC